MFQHPVDLYFGLVCVRAACVTCSVHTRDFLRSKNENSSTPYHVTPPVPPCRERTAGVPITATYHTCKFQPFYPLSLAPFYRCLRGHPYDHLHHPYVDRARTAAYSLYTSLVARGYRHLHRAATPSPSPPRPPPTPPPTINPLFCMIRSDRIHYAPPPPLPPGAKIVHDKRTVAVDSSAKFRRSCVRELSVERDLTITSVGIADDRRPVRE